MREPYPVVVATRLGALAAHAKQLQLYSQQPISEANSLRDGLGELRYALSQLERHEALPVVDVSAQPMNVDPERLQHLRTEATKAEARIEACVIEHKKRHELYAIAAHVLNSAKAWIEKLPDAVALVEVPPVRVENGADHRKTLTVVRTQLAELQGKRTAVRNAPVPLYDLDQRAQAWIESQARRQKLVVATGAHELFNVRFAKSASNLTDPSPTPEVLPLLCALVPKAVHAAIIASAGNQQDGALDDAERAAKLAEVGTKIGDLEEAEEAVVQACIERGDLSVTRRRDATPSVLLGVRIVTRERSAVAA